MTLEDVQQALDNLIEFDNLNTWTDYNPEAVTGNTFTLEDSWVTYNWPNESNNITCVVYVCM